METAFPFLRMALLPLSGALRKRKRRLFRKRGRRAGNNKEQHPKLHRRRGREHSAGDCGCKACGKIRSAAAEYGRFLRFLRFLRR